jgi:hypothetical protein
MYLAYDDLFGQHIHKKSQIDNGGRSEASGSMFQQYYYYCSPSKLLIYIIIMIW